jgi:hypothetical protein
MKVISLRIPWDTKHHSGKDTATVQPFSGAEVIVRSAPMNSARSRIPDNPIPHGFSLAKPLPSSRMLMWACVGR